MWATVISLFGGIISKVVVGLISSWASSSNTRNLSTTSANVNMITAVQKGNDNADWTARVTRIFIVIPIVWMFLYLCWYVVTQNPDLSYTIEANRYMSPVWQFLLPFPINEKGYVTINGVFVIERIWVAVFFIIGFYCTKFGR